MEERDTKVRRLFTQAAQKIGSRARLAEALGISYEEVGRYMAGEASPPEDVLARATALVFPRKT